MPDFLKATAEIPPSFRFDGRRIREGDEIACEQRMTSALLALGCFERIDGPSHSPLVDTTFMNCPGGRDGVAGVDGANSPTLVKRKRGRPRKGFYKHRDMRAE